MKIGRWKRIEEGEGSGDEWSDGGERGFWVQELRHVDSDVNTEEEELYVAQVRYLSSRYLPAGKVTSL